MKRIYIVENKELNLKRLTLRTNKIKDTVNYSGLIFNVVYESPLLNRYIADNIYNEANKLIEVIPNTSSWFRGDYTHLVDFVGGEIMRTAEIAPLTTNILENFQPEKIKSTNYFPHKYEKPHPYIAYSNNYYYIRTKQLNLIEIFKIPYYELALSIYNEVKHQAIAV